MQREELEAKYGKITNEDWKKFDPDGDGAISLEEWNGSKTARMAKQSGLTEKELKGMAGGFMKADHSGE